MATGEMRGACMHAPIASMPGVVSPSQASTFLSCQARWYFRYMVGLPDPPSGDAVRGQAVHKLIEYAMRAKMAGVVLEAGGLADAWEAAWDQAAEGAEFRAGDVESLKASGARLAHKYVTEALPAIEPAAVEVPFSGTIADVPVRGIADLVTVVGMVIDIKTASRKPSGLAAQIEHTPGEVGRRLVDRVYPLVAEGIAGGLYLPNRSSSVCSRRYCPFADAWRASSAAPSSERDQRLVSSVSIPARTNRARIVRRSRAS